MKEIGVSTSLVTEEDFKPQKAGSKKGSTKGQTWEKDFGREWISSKHQAIGKQVANDPLEKNATKNTARPWWVALETKKELEDCLKKLDHVGCPASVAIGLLNRKPRSTSWKWEVS